MSYRGFSILVPTEPLRWGQQFGLDFQAIAGVFTATIYSSTSALKLLNRSSDRGLMNRWPETETLHHQEDRLDRHGPSDFAATRSHPRNY